MKKIKLLIFALTAIFSFVGVVFAAEMTSESQVDNYTTFLMPTFESDSEISVVRPVQLNEESASLARPLKIVNYSTKIQIELEKGTKVTSKSGEFIYPLLKPPRKTLFNVAGMDNPKGKQVIYQFLITFGNTCTADQIENDTCTAKPEHFSPAGKLTIPLPEGVEEGSFDLMFFNPETKKWSMQVYDYDDIAKLIALDYPQTGFIAFVKHSDGAYDNLNETEAETAVETTTDTEVEDTTETTTEAEEETDNSTGEEVVAEDNTQEEEETEVEADSGMTAEELLAELQARPYRDIPTAHWLYDDLEYMIDQGVFTANNEGNFNPDDFVNRAEAAKILVNTFDLPLSEDVDLLDFSRVSWFAEYAQTMINLGIMTAYETKVFMPIEEISRAEALTIILRAARIDLDSDYVVNPFSDVPADIWYAPAVAFAVDHEIISGIGDEFVADRSVTRAEFVKMTKRVLGYQKTLSEDELGEFPGRQPEKFRFSEEDLKIFNDIFEEGDSADDISRIKKILSYYGYYTGEIDNEFTAELHDALKQYQLDAGIITDPEIVGAGDFGPSTRHIFNIRVLPALQKEWLSEDL